MLAMLHTQTLTKVPEQQTCISRDIALPTVSVQSTYEWLLCVVLLIERISAQQLCLLANSTIVGVLVCSYIK